MYKSATGCDMYAREFCRPRMPEFFCSASGELVRPLYSPVTKRTDLRQALCIKIQIER